MSEYRTARETVTFDLLEESHADVYCLAMLARVYLTHLCVYIRRPDGRLHHLTCSASSVPTEGLFSLTEIIKNAGRS